MACGRGMSPGRGSIDATARTRIELHIIKHFMFTVLGKYKHLHGAVGTTTIVITLVIVRITTNQRNSPALPSLSLSACGAMRTGYELS